MHDLIFWQYLWHLNLRYVSTNEAMTLLGNNGCEERYVNMKEYVNLPPSHSNRIVYEHARSMEISKFKGYKYIKQKMLMAGDLKSRDRILMTMSHSISAWRKAACAIQMDQNKSDIFFYIARDSLNSEDKAGFYLVSIKFQGKTVY